MAIRKITFNSANVTAQNDSDFYNFLVGKNGILKGVRENAKATNNSNKITFQAGYVAIYGRLILIEKDTNITIPLTQNAKGYVVVSVNLALNNVELTYKEGSTNYPNLTQENLISNSSGVYELAICAYSKTTTSLTLDSNFTPEYINQKANNFYGKNNTGKMLKVGSDGYLELIDENTLFVDKAKKDANGKVINEEYAKKVNLDDHASNVENPHNVTKKQVGLEFVDNTSDANKPISILQQVKFEEISKDYNKKISDLSDNIDLEMKGKADLGIDGKIPSDQMPTTGIIMDSAKKDGEGNVIDATYETKTDATSKLNKAKDHTTTEVSNLKKYTDEQFKKINDNLIATVDCTHQYEITGNTGDEHGLAIDDQQMLIKKIQGHSRRKSLNSYKPDPFTESQSGVIITFKDGILNLNGTSSSNNYKAVYSNFEVSQQTTFSFTCSSLKQGSDTWQFYIQSTDNSFAKYQLGDNGQVTTFTLEKGTYYVGLGLYANQTYNNLKLYPMLVEGTYTNETMPPFQPYDNTLVNSNNQLISSGRNILNPDDFGAKCSSYDKSTGIATLIAGPEINGKVLVPGHYFAPNTSYTFIFRGKSSSSIGQYTQIRIYYTIGTYHEPQFNDGLATYTSDYGKTIEKVIGSWANGTTTLYLNECAIIKGANQDFEPYKQDIVQAPSLGEFDYYQEGKIYRQTSQVVTLNGSESWGIDSNSPNKRFYYRPVDAVDNVTTINVASNNLKAVNANDTYSLSQENNLISVASSTIHIVKREFTTIDQLKQWLAQNPIQLVYKLATPTIEDYAMPSGMVVYNGGLQIQQGDIPYTITKQYNLSQKAQILANIEVDREQAKMIDEVNNKIINLPSPSIANRTVKNISINNTFPQTLTSEQTKDVFNNDLFVIFSVGGSLNFYEYKNVIENPSEGKTFINISPGMQDSVSENVSFYVLYVEYNGYIRKESFQIDKFPVYQHSILITDEKDIQILCSIVAKRGRTISEISELKYLINASGLKVVCNGFVKPTLGRQGGMAFELNTQSGDVKVKYVDLSSNSNLIYDVALNSISNLKIIDTVYDYTVANG